MAMTMVGGYTYVSTSTITQRYDTEVVCNCFDCAGGIIGEDSTENCSKSYL